MKVCVNCGESWSYDTPGYANCLIGTYCIACIHETRKPLIGRDLDQYLKIRAMVKDRIARVNNLLRRN